MIRTSLTLATALATLSLAACSAETESSIGTSHAYQTGLTCSTNQDMNPLKAALAVSMASEMGNIDAVNQLTVDENWRVAVSDQGFADCAAHGDAGCPNTVAILSMQDQAVNQVISQDVFNAVTFNQELIASFNRQRDHEHNLEMNQAHRVPQDHELAEVGITDRGACGVHYDFAAHGEKIENIQERLVFFGGTQNPFIDFRSGDDLVSIDPTGTMNGDDTNSNPICANACYAYGTQMNGECCSCNGSYGQFHRAYWNPSMVYCAY